MRIARKFTLALVACVIAALTINAVVTVRDEISRFEQETAAHQVLIGRALRPAIISVWSIDGRARALALLRESDQRLRRLEIKWVWLRAPQPDQGAATDDREFVPLAPLARLAPLFRGEDVTVLEPGHVVSYVPFAPPEEGVALGAIEIAQTREREHQVRAAALRQAALVVVAVTLVTALVTSLLGSWLVGRPMSAFIEQARRIGKGDLSYRIPITQRDEFGSLGEEMNRMCASLAELQESAGRANEAKITAIEQLRHADRLATVGRLAAGMAHELGTPLNVVSARAKPISTGKVEGQTAKDNARIIVEQVERMAKIMRQLLDFARKRELSKTTADLATAVRRVVTFLEPLAKKSGVTVIVDAPSDALEARVDPAQMDQVVTNLVINAVQASARGSEVKVQVAREDAASAADGHPSPVTCSVVRVVDHGSGIAPEHLTQVFEPFFTTKEIGEGTGLGLSVAYGIVKDHGGWIQVRSELGKGSSFAVMIPQDKA